MKVLLFGASGMVGQGVLRECLLDAEITQVVAAGRRTLEQSDPKLSDLVVKDF
ncbi:MAG: epimerase, partial [Comamonadaceae bacterium]